MKKLLVLFAMLVLALSVQAQMDNMKSDANAMKADAKAMKSDMKPDVAKSIAKMEEQWAAASKMGDSAKLAPMLADSFVNMNSDGSVLDKAGTLNRMKSDKWEANQVSDIKVTTHGNTAIAAGAWYGKGMSGGKAVDAHERWVDTWMMMPSGKWQCVASASAPAKM